MSYAILPTILAFWPLVVVLIMGAFALHDYNRAHRATIARRLRRPQGSEGK